MSSSDLRQRRDVKQAIAAPLLPNSPDADGAFQQQHMASWQPVFYAGCVVPVFCGFGALFVALGIWMFSVQASLQAVGPLRYDNATACRAALERSPCVSKQRYRSYGGSWPNGTQHAQRPLNPLCVPLRYEDDSSAANLCSQSFTVDKAIAGPVFFFFELGNLYQNHRLYVADRADNQLLGTESSHSLLWKDLDEQMDYQGCKAARSCADTGEGATMWLPLHASRNAARCSSAAAAGQSGMRWCGCTSGVWDNATAAPCAGLNQSLYTRARLQVPRPGEACPSSAAAEYRDTGYADAKEQGGQCWTQWCNPCGLLARSFFTDKFLLLRKDAKGLSSAAKPVSWQGPNIYERDREKFGDAGLTPGWDDAEGAPQLNVRTAEQNELVQSAEFISWMRASSLPRVVKLHRVLPHGLPAGEYTLRIRNNYDPLIFGGGTKSFKFLARHPYLGTDASTLGAVCCMVGGMCLAVSAAMLCKVWGYEKPGGADEQAP